MFDWILKKLFNKAFRRELQLFQRQIERLEATMERSDASRVRLMRRVDKMEPSVENAYKDYRALSARLSTIEPALAQMKVGARLSPKGGSWVVLAYTLGEKDYLNFYDFRNSNIGALRDFVEKFAKSGMAVRLATPFDRNKEPKKEG